jgi:hypothetical protein
MQVTLTSHGEALLREALARHPGQSAAEILDPASAERIVPGAPGPPGPVHERLKVIPGVKLPDHWPPRFDKFEPLRVEGEPVSEKTRYLQRGTEGTEGELRFRRASY